MLVSEKITELNKRRMEIIKKRGTELDSLALASGKFEQQMFFDIYNLIHEKHKPELDFIDRVINILEDCR